MANAQPGLRWLRRGRRAGDCPAWRALRVAQIAFVSPVDVNFHPLREQIFDCEPVDLTSVAQQLGVAELWRRSDHYIGLTAPSGLRLYDFIDATGQCEAMFVPNGEASIEWKLGYDITIDADWNLAILPGFMIPGLEVIGGILSPRFLKRLNARGGMSIAIRPVDRVTIRKGDVVAAGLLIGNKSLKPQLDIA